MVKIAARATSCVVQDGICPYTVEPCSGVLNITIKSTIVVRSRSRLCGGGDICGTTPAYLTRFNKIAIQGSPQMAVD